MAVTYVRTERQLRRVSSYGTLAAALRDLIFKGLLTTSSTRKSSSLSLVTVSLSLKLFLLHQP